ncbi:hypothetical protein [Thalassoglobus polymorphus]|uniref:hypothetical protein n=1 Tax=Thalassoglobus polymorphus TaxID=2527994 RepID=UPI0011A7A531|nr:hypothetical protein [Thalassoglobus polymorphus]
MFNSTATDAIQDSGEGIWITDTELTGSNGVMVTDSTGTYTFADTDIALSSGSDPSLSLKYRQLRNQQLDHERPEAVRRERGR